MSSAPTAASLIEYPCHFPIKVMGSAVPGFLETMVELARGFDPEFLGHTVEQRPSSSGTYLGLTLTVRVTSREQLDDLYRALTSHPMVKVVL
jgi:putative lipoic acid-binding regulatory protein